MRPAGCNEYKRASNGQPRQTQSCDALHKTHQDGHLERRPRAV